MKYYVSDLSEKAANSNICTDATTINGATAIMDGGTPNRSKGFSIEGNDDITGNNSEVILKRISVDEAFTLKEYNISVVINVTNINKISGTAMPLLPRLRKFKDGIQVGDDTYITGYTRIESGTTASKIYTYTNIKYSLSNSDISNGYYYQIVFRLANTVKIATGFTVSVIINSYSMTSTILHEVHIPDKNLKKTYELESGQMFFRQKLEGSIKFLSDDYTYIYDKIFGESGVFDTTMYFYAIDTLQYFYGSFMATDCEVNMDDEKIEVTINPYDEYTDILNGLDKTLDVIKITPEMTSVDIAERPVIQVYMPNENVLTGIVGDTYWEEDTAKSVQNYQDIVDDNKFAADTELITIDLDTIAGSPQHDIRGKYYGYVPISYTGSVTGYLYKVNEHAGSYTYRIEMARTITAGGSPPDWLFQYVASVYYDGNLIYRNDNFSYNDGFNRFIKGQGFNYTHDFSLYQQGGDYGTTYVIGEGVIKQVALRVATNQLSVLGNNTFPRVTLTDGDIAVENLNYLRVVGASLGIGRISSILSSTKSAYGTNGTLYYHPPRPELGVSFFPIFRNSWATDCSYWVAYKSTEAGDAIDSAASTIRNQKYCYTLTGVIKAFLNDIAPSVVFESTSDYSKFFFDDVNPLSGSGKYEYLIIQKSNVLHGINAKPAQKAPLTFGSLMNMLKNVFKCYWFIEDGKFRLEHVKFFNSGSYTSSPSIQLDLTLWRNEHNSKYWSFNTSSFKFDKESLAERYEFEYMDNCTEAFSGSPINVLNRYVQRGKVESVNISDFSADIDYILANPNDISEDGFVLIAKIEGIVPFYKGTIKGNAVNLQNGILSFPFIHKYFYMHDLPAKSVNINEEDDTALGILKKKEQEVKFPYSVNPASNQLFTYATDPKTNQLIKTSIGNGKIIKMNVNLSNRMVEATLAYDTEQL